ncbi:ABC transporter substrate-binding protein [Trujillonella endophytica]|uniref:Substrate-binding protein n=1 Tax=Trujillonella endophytica TaxID=673521 RepID=A0A1H8SVI7_9ACTN|nr:ABC transporter substrate-binding protein [Trujillella endophytica]SEO82770.1 substrate-binding protein [Trujillella endophytica]
MTSRKRTAAYLGLACTVAMLASACGSDDEAGGGGEGGGGIAAEGTVKVGLVNHLSGPNAAGSEALRAGVEARFATYESEGGACAGDLDFEVVEADDQSSPQGNLTAVQSLVQQEEVYAIISASPFFNGGIGWMTTQGAQTPVVGYALDGPQPQWLEFDNNLFSAFPLPVADDVYSSLGDHLAGKGATKLAGVSFAAESSQAGLANGLASAEAAGVEVVYENTNVQFGSTDVGPIVLGILDSGADSVYLAITPDSGLAVVAGLRQAGWDGTILLPTGYGPELVESGVGAQIAQGVDFTTSIAPYELGSDAAVRLAEAIAQQTGDEVGTVGFYENVGWVSTDAFLHGLDAAGCDATQQELMDTMRGLTDFDAGGLYPSALPFDSKDYEQSCSWYLTLTGEEYVLDGDEATCGGLVDA